LGYFDDIQKQAFPELRKLFLHYCYECLQVMSACIANNTQCTVYVYTIHIYIWGNTFNDWLTALMWFLLLMLY